MPESDIDQLAKHLSKLPGLGPRSARRAVLHLLTEGRAMLQPMVQELQRLDESITTCEICRNIDTSSPCHICTDEKRDPSLLCVVEDIADLWALERNRLFQGRYHVLGGTLSAIDGRGPEQLGITQLVNRAKDEAITEVIIGTNATVEGQTTAHYIADRLHDANVKVTKLAHGIPVGGELDYLDEGTLGAALLSRQSV
jgi:recombination protein RecR